MRIYLDNAATTPLAPEVLEVQVQVMKDVFGNPSSVHAEGRKAKAILETARKTIAGGLQANPSEICFTSGGTEADNMAIRGSVKGLGVKHIITSKAEHHAVLHTIDDLVARGNAEAHYVSLTDDGHIRYDELEQLITKFPGSLVSLMHGNNETGNISDIFKIGELCRANQSWFHSDTVQTMCQMPFDLSSLPVDFIVGSGHKFNGPKGVGFLYTNKRVKINPILTGGSQERDMRPGTENISGIAGLAAAFELSKKEMEAKLKHISSLKRYMVDEIQKRFPLLIFNGDVSEGNLHTVLNVAFPPSVKGEMLLFTFDLMGVAVSSGSACSSGANKGSHVISAIGRNEDYTPIRFSFGKYNTRADIDFALNCIEKVLNETETA